jgi:hypothetical protein
MHNDARHPLAAIEAAVFLRSPIPLIAPRPEVGIGPLREQHAPKAARAWSNVSAVPAVLTTSVGALLVAE